MKVLKHLLKVNKNFILILIILGSCSIYKSNKIIASKYRLFKYCLISINGDSTNVYRESTFYNNDTINYCKYNCDKINLKKFISDTFIFKKDSILIFQNGKSYFLFSRNDTLLTHREVFKTFYQNTEINLFISIDKISNLKEDKIYKFTLYSDQFHSEIGFVFYYSFDKGLIQFTEYIGSINYDYLLDKG